MDTRYPNYNPAFSFGLYAALTNRWNSSSSQFGMFTGKPPKKRIQLHTFSAKYEELSIVS